MVDWSDDLVADVMADEMAEMTAVLWGWPWADYLAAKKALLLAELRADWRVEPMVALMVVYLAAWWAKRRVIGLVVMLGRPTVVSTAALLVATRGTYWADGKDDVTVSCLVGSWARSMAGW